MRSYTNNRVTGTDPRTTWESREQHRGEEIQFYDTPTIKWSQTVRGTRADAIIPSQPTPQQVTNGRPFQVYNVPNNSASGAQQAIYTGAGVNINDYTFQVRSAIIGVRSFLATHAQRYAADAAGVIGSNYAGNLESLIYVPATDFVGSLLISGSGTNFSDGQFDDPLAQNNLQFGSGYIPQFGDALLTDFGITEICSQIIVDPTPDTNGDAMASIWLELYDVAAGDPAYLPGINIRMWGHRFYYQTTDNPFPNGKSIIPIAVFNRHVASASDTRLPFTQVEQIQWGNLVNRYPPGISIWRGRWVADALNGQCFYLNDEVFDDTGGGGGLGRFTCIAATPFLAAFNPAADPTNWIKTS